LSTSTISPARLIAFSDGIFAIAITLLVFNLKIPRLPAGSGAGLSRTIIDMVPQFLTYIMSFLLIAVFWFIHHHIFSHIHRVDNAFIWLNVAYLLGISFLPFPSALLGAYPDERFSLLFYIGCLSFVGCMLLSIWGYASYKHRLIEKDLSRAAINYFFWRGISSQIIFLITALLALIHLSWGKHFLFVLIPVQLLMQRIYKKNARVKLS
jgi:uncharacterized membrane protein